MKHSTILRHYLNYDAIRRFIITVKNVADILSEGKKMLVSILALPFHYLNVLYSYGLLVYTWIFLNETCINSWFREPRRLPYSCPSSTTVMLLSFFHVPQRIGFHCRAFVFVPALQFFHKELTFYWYVGFISIY